MKENLLLVLFISFSILNLIHVQATQAQTKTKAWKAGVAKVVITPQQSLWMAGYAARDHPAEGTLHDLWALAWEVNWW